MNLKSPEEIEVMAKGGKILAQVMERVVKEVRVGVTLKELDQLTEDLIRKAGAKPAFLNYKPEGAKKTYAASICTSVNDTIVHGFPTQYRLKSGDVFKLDFGVLYRDFYTDAAVTILMGEASVIAQKLVEATKDALRRAIKKCEPGNTLGDIGHEIESATRKYGFKTVKGLTGHGIGRRLHEEPSIHNYGKKGEGLKLRPGMVLALEPMFSAGTDRIIQKKDESWATADGSLSAHFEHTVAVTEKGPRMLTKIIND